MKRMRNLKKLAAFALAFSLVFALAACGSTEEDATDESTTTGASASETTVLKVAASPTPHAEILTSDIVTELLAAEGITLDVTEYSDYVVPNTSVDEGENDCNYFQHTPYLDTFNEENGTSLVSVGKIHYEPFGLYSNTLESVDDIAEGATIAIPNDGSNEARALYLLQDLGLITLSGDSFNSNATVLDIEENPLNLQFTELEAAMVARALDDVDAAIVNGNYALEAGLDINDAIATEAADSDAAQTYANIIATTEENADNEAILTLVEVLKSSEVQEWIEENFDGAVLPVD
ncbi:MAG: MetQ/NlpA family ABC transporter substrate-binding protein [Lachnospiraceae bacterium]|nr:MetQ/NlpA family ABC transporter substrate-binding protein [Lachnospiraceae bacterium]